MGKYHAQIAFVQAPNRAAAEGGMATAPKTLINIEIGERIVEKLESNLFKTKKNINTSGMVTFEYGISNLGNRDILPTGKIAIFNRSGAEVAELPVNGLAESIKVGEAKQYSINWNTGNMIGKYRARLQVEYGGEAKEHFQDTIYFWVLPMWLLIAIGGVGLFLLFIVFYLFMKMLRQDTVAIHYDYEVEERSHIIDLKNKKHDDDD